MEINNSTVLAEVQAAFARYEAALMSNDVAELQLLFWRSPQTIRYGIAENLYGHDEIGGFRAARSPAGLARRLSRTVITTFGPTFTGFGQFRRHDHAVDRLGQREIAFLASRR